MFVNEFNEENDDQSTNLLSRSLIDVAAILSTEALNTADIIISKGSVHLRKEDPSTIAAGIIYYARKNVFTSGKFENIPKIQSIWPDELVLLTRCTEA